MSSASSFSHLDRTAELHRLRSFPEIYDLCVIGGGVTGAAIARDATLRGWKVLLVEKNDFGSGTSSRSSKLVHGGVRYLEQYEFHLVFEATRERARLWRLAPQLTTPLPFLFPAFKESRVPLWKLNLGLWLYDVLAMFRMPSLHRRYGRDRTLQEEPLLRPDDLRGSIFYWDGMTDDALITLANVIDARTRGATTLPRVRFDRVDWDGQVSVDAQAAHTLHFEDTLTHESLTARARVVVSAAGPWTDSILKGSGNPRKILAPTRGSHIVVSAKKLPARHAVVMMHPQDGRVLFVIPWGESTVIGTTDLFDDDPERVAISSEEVDYLLKATRYYFPSVALTPADVQSTWSGLRPLLAPPENASASEISREHHIEWREPGFLIIAGGKLTTHREMAEQTLERIYRETAPWKNPPGQGYRATETHELPLPLFAVRNADPALSLGVSEAARLSFDDVRTMCRKEIVLALEDLLVRRTQIFYKEPHNGFDLLPKLETVLREELGWDAREWERQVADYRGYVAKNVLTPLGRT